MTMSTFSNAISPPLLRWNMRHIGNPQRLIAFHRSVDDVDRVRAQHAIHERPWSSGPTLDLVLPHAIDKLVLVRGREKRKIPPEDLATVLVDVSECSSVEIGKRRADVEDAGLKKRLVRRHRKLLIDIVRDPRLARLRYQRFAESLQRLALTGIEKAERHIARPRFARRHQNFYSTYGESQRAQRRAFDKAAPTNRHGHLLPEHFFFREGPRKICGITGQPRSRVKGP